MSRLRIDRRWSLDEHVAWHGTALRGPAGPDASRRLLMEIERSGLRGRGGGWFPTAVKMRAVATSVESRRSLVRRTRPVVVANAMEGEPASAKDVTLLTRTPHLVLDGIAVAAALLGSDEAHLALHEDSPALAVVLRAVADREAARLDETRVHVTTAPALYVASEESALAHWVGAGDPRPTSGPRPFQRGVDGRPTLVQNVETLAHLALVARHGGDWFAAKGAPSAPGTTLVTVGGAVASPGVVEVPTGTAVADILASRGGLTSTPRGWLTGGYGGAWVRTDGFLQTRWDPDSLREVGGVIGASVLWVMGDDVCPLSEAARVVRWMAGQSAGQCGPCMFGLPAVADDLHRLAGLTMTAGDLTRLEGRLGMVRNRGACKHPDGVSRFAATALDVFDDEVRLHLSGRCSSTHATAIRSHHLPVPRDHGVPVPASVGVAR